MKIDKFTILFYNVGSKSWVVEPGEFEVLLGNSLRNILLSKKLKYINNVLHLYGKD